MFRRVTINFLTFLMCIGICYADDNLAPKQDIKNTKGFASINYDRQDSEQTGVQKIINDHSAFNINVMIIKKGALFSKNKDDIILEKNNNNNNNNIKSNQMI